MHLTAYGNSPVPVELQHAMTHSTVNSHNHGGVLWKSNIPRVRKVIVRAEHGEWPKGLCPYNETEPPRTLLVSVADVAIIQVPK